MALIYQLLRVLVLGVTAAAVDDVPVVWPEAGRALLPCVVPEWTRVQPRRPLPLQDDGADDASGPYTWRKGGKEINPKRIYENGTLEVLVEAGNTSEGVYQCAVKQHDNIVLGYPVQLKLTYMDEAFSEQPQGTIARLDQPLSIPCRIASGPAASISWTKDGRPLPQDYRYQALESELLITGVQHEDAGVYKCKATNPYMNKSLTSSEGRVEIEDSRYEEPSFLSVRVNENIIAQRGTRVVLPCPVLGWPRSKLLWKLTPPGEERTGELESTEEVLELTKLEYDQEGLYTCAIEGHSNMEKRFHVTLTEEVRITIPPVSKEVMRASTLRFNCTASGKPEPNITWFKNGEKLAMGGRINVRISADRMRMELVLSGVTSDDTGTYQCFASNGLTVSSSWAHLNVTGPGAAVPQDLRCSPTGASTVRLSWVPVVDDQATAYYVVNIISTDEHGKTITPQPHTNTEEIVRVKEPLTPYFFQVRAFIASKTKNNIASDFSKTVVCQGQGVPIKLTKTEDKRILASWNNFAAQTPDVVQWILQYKPENDDVPVHNITLSSAVTNYTLKSPESQPLAVRVLGSRTLEWLSQDLTLVPWTSTSAALPDSDEGEMKMSIRKLEVTEVGETSFGLKWKCEESWRYSFLVCVRRVDGKDSCRESNDTSIKIDSLQPDSEYEVRIQVRIKGRQVGGAFTEPYHITTQPEGTHRFKDLKYKYVNPNTLRVSWSGAPAKYTVYHRPELSLPVEQWDSLEIMGNTVLITGIEPTEATYVMVTGYEPLEHSPIINIPPQVKKLEDKDLTYEYTSSGVTVSWNGTGQRMALYTQNITQPFERWSSVNITGSSVELNNLQEGPVYVMVVAAGGGTRCYPTPLTIPERPPDQYFYLGVGLGCGACALCAVAGGALCLWRRAKANSATQRSRRTQTTTAEGTEEDGSEMRMASVANGGAGEPLLNGHVHITENPASKTPNGRVKKGRRFEPPSFETPSFAAFDLSRYDQDTTVETVLDDTTALSLLDTSRKPDHDLSISSKDLSGNSAFNKLPDDNMNSELTRSTEFQLDNSKIQPTLQPNG